MSGMPADTRFAPVIVISQIQDGRRYGGQESLPGPDIAVIVAIWGPSYQDKTHTYNVRGVPVGRTTVSETRGGRIYRICVFPDGRTMWVNEGNISSRKIK